MGRIRYCLAIGALSLFFAAPVSAQESFYTGMDFDPLKFEWIGVPVQQTFICAFTKSERDYKYGKMVRVQHTR
jgi:hypothetical protein